MINSSGIFTVMTTDTNGCTSPNSDELVVIVKPSPICVSILQSGSFTLETTASGLFDVKYEWFKNNVLLQNFNSMIKAKTDCVYAVKGFKFYQMGAGRILMCFSPLSSKYEFKIYPSVQGFSVFPKPAPNSIINFETQEDLKDVVVNIHNLKGTLIKSYDVPYFDCRRTIDLSETHRGSLLINVKAKDFNVIKRVYIE